MLQKFYRTLGLALISLNTFFTPIMAYADSDTAADVSSIGIHLVFTLLGGVITGCVLVSMSLKKVKATKADKYIKSNLRLHDQQDIYIRTTTDKVKINDKD